MWKVLFNTKQLREWVDAAKTILVRFGIEKALGYLIGEEFYRVAFMLYYHKQLIRMIAEKRKKPGYNPTFEIIHNNRKIVNNLDKIYEENIMIAADTEEAATRFAAFIKKAFEPYEIESYFASNPRLGIHGHIGTDEDYEFLLSRGAVEHSIDTEVRDALILGDIMKYLEVS